MANHAITKTISGLVWLNSFAFTPSWIHQEPLLSFFQYGEQVNVQANIPLVHDLHFQFRVLLVKRVECLVPNRKLGTSALIAL